MPTSIPLPRVDQVPETRRPGAGIDFELFLDCVHCGLCTAACPTYLELGTEMDSPRGRIYLMRGVVEGRIPLDQAVHNHLDLCLDCRACESACPSGVQYGRLIEPFRSDLRRILPAKREPLPWWQRWLLYNVFPYPRRVQWALWPARVMQRLGLDRWLERTGLDRWLIPQRARQMQAILPRLKPRGPELPEFLPARGPRRAVVAFQTGCVNSVLFHETNWATARVLQANGCDVWIPRGQSCCGALHYHAGYEASAIQFAQRNCDVFLARPVDAIVTNVAGCGSTLKDYHHLLEGTNYAQVGKNFAGKVRDVNEFLADLGLIPPAHAVPLRATYHDACHLCHAQQIRQAPRQLLAAVPGMTLVPLPESEVCCGAAGSYNLTQPEMADRLGQRKTEHILGTKAQAVITANAGCLLQIGKMLRNGAVKVWVAHPMDVLWAAYSGTTPWHGGKVRHACIDLMVSSPRS